MKNTYSKQLFSLAFLMIFSLIVWFGGPLLNIANHTPLASAEKRFYTIALFYLCWFLKLMFFPPKPQHIIAPLPALRESFWKKLIPTFSKKTAAAKTKTPQAAFRMSSRSVEEKRFAGAVNFLSKTTIKKEGAQLSLQHLPWYLLIGPSGSGKTTLLANSNVNLVLAKQFKAQNIKNISASECSDWWVTRDLVLIDVPGSYSKSLWQNLLGLVTHYREKTHLGGAIVALPVSELVMQQNRDTLIQTVKQQLIDLKKKCGNTLPIYFVITKCDLLPGFIEFFHDAGSDELAQTWGVVLPSLKGRGNEQWIDTFTQRFNALIKRLNKQLIWRLHQERDPLARPLIKDFPLHIERLKEGLIDLAKAFSFDGAALCLQGVYLTSAVQHPEEDQTTLTAATTSQALQIMQAPRTPVRSYFIRQFFLKALNSIEAQPASPLVPIEKKRRPMWAYVLSFIAVILAFNLGNDYRHTVNETVAIRDGYTQYQHDIEKMSSQDSHLAKALPLLNALQRAAEDSKQAWLIHSSREQKTANAAYHEALATIVLPEIKNALEKYLQSSGSKIPENVYAALKAYLMLGNNQQLKPDFITNTLKQIAPNMMNDQIAEQLSHHLHAAFGYDWQPMTLNSELISHVRRLLVSLAPNELHLATNDGLGNWVLGKRNRVGEV